MSIATLFIAEQMDTFIQQMTDIEQLLLSRQLDEALPLLESLSASYPNDTKVHHLLATLYTQKKDFPQALTQFKYALDLAPDNPTIHLHLGLMFLKQNMLNYAKIQMHNVLSLDENNTDALFHLGVINLLEENFDAAKDYFSHLLSIDAHHVEAMVNLGVIALKQAENQSAIDYFTKALLINEGHLEARHNLATTFMHHNRFENALMHYDVLLKHDPNNIECLYNSGVADMALGHLDKAEKYFNHLLSNAPNHVDAMTNLAAIFIKKNDKNTAKVLLEKVITLKPDDSITQHMYQAITQKETEQSCPEYAKNLFDRYALYYDNHLQQLNYRVPEIVQSILNNINLPQQAHMLDLGCGTGLMGKELRPFAGKLTGVDISEEMIAEAKKKNIYDKLITKDIINFLTYTKDVFDVVVAADVLPYFGELTALFSLVQKRLTNKGHFIFTFEEESSIKNIHLNTTMRFSHSESYMKHLAKECQFTLLQNHAIQGRSQENKAVEMRLMVLRSDL